MSADYQSFQLSPAGDAYLFREMETVFGDVLCPFINCPPARERKQRLVTEGTAISNGKSFLFLRVWEMKIWIGSEEVVRCEV